MLLATFPSTTRRLRTYAPQEIRSSTLTDTKPATNGTPALDNEIYDGIFDKEDRTGIIAGLIDISILGVGVVVALVWQLGLISHQAPTSSSQWQPPPAISANSPNAASSLTSTSSPTSTHAHVSICQAFVRTTFKNGQTHYVEFRGNCAAVKAIAANSKTPSRVLPARHYTVALSGS